ncbi:ATP-grasp domain-containing protein [Gimesia sp.]|uniref:ATP-grasp domain-containing protein n=1 Tax=Gimesia sp. TaxID=2024833 RepID=UPI0025C4BBC5|nr:ATP-grasp domain-containing protein [Gimesia sp.]
MNIFVSEYLCSGACELSDTEAGIFREGTAMLEAVISDLLALPHMRVITSLQQNVELKLPLLEQAIRAERLQIFRVDTPEQEREIFKTACLASDCVLIIAPEFEELLSRRTQQALDYGAVVSGPDLTTIQLTADKWRLFEMMQEHSLPTIPTRLLSAELLRSAITFPCLIKHRFGAGGLGLEAFENEKQLRNRWNLLSSAEGQYLFQPFLQGKPLSTVALIRPGERDYFPVGEQQISWDQGFAYQGGSIPADIDQSMLPSIYNLLDRVCDLLPGLAGYVGFDILLPDDSPHEPLLVEINPRLTTSYTGYRRLTQDNLAERMMNLETEFPRITWQEGVTVRFQPDGTVSLNPQL